MTSHYIFYIDLRTFAKLNINITTRNIFVTLNVFVHGLMRMLQHFKQKKKKYTQCNNNNHCHYTLCNLKAGRTASNFPFLAVAEAASCLQTINLTVVRGTCTLYGHTAALSGGR